MPDDALPRPKPPAGGIESARFIASAFADFRLDE
jgi:hypothetical protein